MFHTKVVDKFKNAFYVQQLSPENRTVYEIIWKNMVKPVRPRMTI